MLAPGEVQCDLPSRRGGDDPAGEHARAIIGRLALHVQHTHAGIVVMQHFSLRRLTDQLIVRWLDHFRGFLDKLPLCRRRQRNAEQFFHPLQPLEGHAAAVLELRNHRRGRFVVLFRTHSFRSLGGEHLSAGIAAQPFQLIHGGGQRCLSHDSH